MEIIYLAITVIGLMVCSYNIGRARVDKLSFMRGFRQGIAKERRENLLIALQVKCDIYDEQLFVIHNRDIMEVKDRVN